MGRPESAPPGESSVRVGDGDLEAHESALNEFDHDALTRLVNEFHSRKSGKLTEAEFVNIVTDATGNEDAKPRLRRLFRQIDASASGRVSCDDLTTYIWEDTQTGDGKRRRGSPFEEVQPHLEQQGAGGERHKGMINDIAFLGTEKLATAGSDGTVRIWSRQRLKHLRSAHVAKSWATAVAETKMGNWIAVGTMERTIKLLDPSSLEVVGSKLRLEYSILTMATCLQNPAKGDRKMRDLIVTGDDAGFVSSYTVEEKQAMDRSDHSQPAHFIKYITSERMHSGSVNRVIQIEGMGLGISISTDGMAVIFETPRLRQMRTIRQPNAKPIVAGCWSSQHKLLLTAGQRQVAAWNPFFGRLAGMLEGFKSPLQTVTIDEEGKEIICSCTDGSVRVFDMQTFGCVRSLASQSIAPTRWRKRWNTATNAIIFDQSRNRLIAGFDEPVAALISADEEHAQGSIQSKAIACLVSFDMERIIVVEDKDRVRVFDSSCGRHKLTFSRSRGRPASLDGESSEATCAALDLLGRRLIVGTSDGDAEMWNFSNGAFLRYLAPPESASFGSELKAIACGSRRGSAMEISGAGAGGDIVRWLPDTHDGGRWKGSKTGDALISHPVVVMRGHKEDCHSLALSANPKRCVLFSGDANGCLLVWNLESGVVIRSMRPPRKFTSRESSGDEGEGYRRATASAEAVACLQSHYDNDIVLSAYSDGCVRLWSGLDGSLRAEFTSPFKAADGLTAIALSPDDDVVAVGDSIGNVLFLQMSGLPTKNNAEALDRPTTELALSHSCHAHRARVHALIYAGTCPMSDGARRVMFASASADKTAKLIASEGTLVATFGGPLYDISSPSTFGEKLPEALSEHPVAYSRSLESAGIGVLRSDEEGKEESDEMHTRGSAVMTAPQRVKLHVEASRGRSATPLDRRVFLPRREPAKSVRLNHPHVQGRGPSQVAHLLHVEDLSALSSKPSRSGADRPTGPSSGRPESAPPFSSFRA